MSKSARAIFYALLLIVGLGVALAGCQPSSDSSVDTSPDYGLTAFIEEQMASGENLSIAAMVLDDGEVYYTSGGEVSPGGDKPDENTQYQMGSITKTFTNMLLAEFIADGRLDYSTTLGELTGDDFVFANDALASVTVEQLATHTSGLARMPSNFAPTDPQDPYKDYTGALLDAEITGARTLQPLVHEYAYSNLGLGLLGYRLGQMDGTSYKEAVLTHVIAPLGLEETGFDRGEVVADGFRSGDVVPAWYLPEPIAAAGALWGSTSDFAQVGKVMLGLEASPLKHDFDSVRDAIAQAGPDFDVGRVWHMAWAGDQPIFWHNGGTGGYLTFFGFRPDTNRAVAILVAGGHMPLQMGLEILGSTELKRSPPPVDESVFGQYEIATGLGIGVYEQAGVLVGQVTGQPAARLYGGDDDWYGINVVDASVKFLRQNGAVTGLELVQGGVVQSAKKIADVAATTQKAETEISEESLAEYTGEYAINAAAKFTIRETGEGLEAQLTGQPFFPVFYKGDDVFFYKVVDAELHFERDDAGAVNALVLHQGAIVQRAEKLE